MTYAEAVRFMSHLRRFGMKLGNDRMVEILRRVGDPHHAYGIAHVTGTKGKGSTTAMIAAILHAHGFRVGGYYSPYVYDLCERVQLNGQNIARRDFARFVARLVPHVEEISAGPLGSVTEFELKTALGFLYFAEKQVDYAVVEVGIGGRLDATNVIHPLVSVITNVGLDHTDILGDTIADIAFQKAGIIKPGVPVITAAEDPEAWQVIERTAAEQTAEVVRVVRQDAWNSPAQVSWAGDHTCFEVRTPDATYEGLGLQLIGSYQCVNAACAIGAVEAMADRSGFDVHPDAVRLALSNVSLPGRFAVLRERPMVVADGAHNGLAARALAEELRRMHYGRLVLVVGMLRGHEPDAFLRELAPLASIVYATQPGWRRALDAGKVAESARRYCADVRVDFPPRQAARKAIAEADEEDLVLITGSFYTVGDVPPQSLSRARCRTSARAPARERLR